MEKNLGHEWHELRRMVLERWWLELIVAETTCALHAKGDSEIYLMPGNGPKTIPVRA